MNRPTISGRMYRRIWSQRQHKHLRRSLPTAKFFQNWVVNIIIDEILAEEQA